MLTPENTHRTLHVFNPSHDEALAAGTPYYYPSVIARKLASAWALLPALWANNGDVVWVPDDVSTSSIPDWAQHVTLVHQSDLKKAFWETIHEIAPWGWDALVRQQLNKAGAPQTLLPNDDTLANVRQLSSRNTTALVLPKLRHLLHEQGFDTVGTSHIATSLTDVEAFIHAHGEAMAKALWSCSGRGVFRITPPLSESCIGRIKRLLREQGAVELEPLYNSVMDFALEFEALIEKVEQRKKVYHFRIPLLLVYVVCVVSEWLGKLFHKSMTLNTDKYQILKQRNWICDITPLQQDLDFKAQYPLKRGLEEVIEWYWQRSWF